MATKKSESIEDVLVDKIADEHDQSQTYNPLLVALRENDKKHLFQTNVTTAFHKTGYHLFDYYFGAVINMHDEMGRLTGQEARVGQAAGTFNLIIGASGAGKGQPISTKIPAPVPDGYIRLGDLKVGDTIFTYDGVETIVDGVFDKGIEDIYEITFSDGRTAVCDAEHLWEVAYFTNGCYKHEVRSTTELLNDDRHYYVPVLSGPVKYPYCEIPCSSYTMGRLVAHGVVNEPNMTESTTEEEIYISNLLESIIDNYANDCTSSLPINHETAFIPSRFKYNSYSNRMLLVQGLMDTNGLVECTDDHHTVVSYSTKSQRLANDIQEVIWSLGFGAKIIPNQDEYRIIIDMPEDTKETLFAKEPNPYSLLGSIEEDVEYRYIRIDHISHVGEAECRCIHITDPSHLYITEQFIVTHNTTLASQIAANIIRQYKYANVIHFDCENRFDISRCETITQLPSSYFDKEHGERYMIRTGHCGLDIIQEMIVKTYVSKMKLKHDLMVSTGFKDEFGHEVMIFQPTVIIIDSITTVLNETFNPESQREATDAEKMRSNTEGARDAKTLKGFFKDIIPLCKEANIIIYGINHINQNMSMNAFLPVARQQNFLKQDESIPGGKTMIYYPFNIVKLTAKPSDDFTEEGDGFSGYMVMVEPIKSSSNQSGNNSKGISFEMVFSQKYGFDPLRTMIMYGRQYGYIEGNKSRLKFKDDDSFTFSMKTLYKDKDEKPIWENINKYIVPNLKIHLSFIEPAEHEFDNRALDY